MYVLNLLWQLYAGENPYFLIFFSNFLVLFFMYSTVKYFFCFCFIVIIFIFCPYCVFIMFFDSISLVIKDEF